MTAQHILYIPIVFFLGFLLGILVAEKRQYKVAPNFNVNSELNYVSRQRITWKTLLLTLFGFIGVFIITHFFPIPYGPKTVQGALGGLKIFDSKPSFSSTEVYNRLQAFSLEGLDVYKTFTYSIDLIFPVAFFYFLFTLARFVVQRSSLNKYAQNGIVILPFVWLAFDLLENIIVFTLLSAFPARYEFLGSILGYITITKFILLFFSVLMPSLLFAFTRKLK